MNRHTIRLIFYVILFSFFFFRGGGGGGGGCGWWELGSIFPLFRGKAAHIYPPTLTYHEGTIFPVICNRATVSIPLSYTPMIHKQKVFIF